MFDKSPYIIDRRRLVYGFIAGASVPIVLNAIAMGPFWAFALLFGLVCAVILVPVAAVPFIWSLGRLGYLRIWSVVVVAALLAAIPDMMITIAGAGGSLYAHGVWLHTMNGFTWEGIKEFFIIRPAAYGLVGALGGIVFWLIAIGLRVEPMRKHSNVPLNSGRGQNAAAPVS